MDSPSWSWSFSKANRWLPLEKGPLPTAEVLRYAVQIADALDKAQIPLLMGVGRSHYVVSPDGQRFLFNAAIEQGQSPVTVVVNGPAGLRK